MSAPSIAACDRHSHEDVRAAERPPLLPEQLAIFPAIQDWVSLECRGVYLYGTPGAGKTAMALRAGRLMRTRGTPTLFVRAKRMFDELRGPEGTAFDPTRPSAVRDRLYLAPALIIDDLGKEYETEYAMRELYALLDFRHDHADTDGLSTLISSNLTDAELNARYDRPILSRLTGLCRAVNLTGKDLRVKKRKAA